MAGDNEDYKFPDEKETKSEEKIEIEIEDSQIEVVDDTPEQDRGRPPMKEPPSEVTDEELEKYSDGVKKRIQHFSKGYHEERRAKEAALREREAALHFAQQLAEENKRLQGQTQTNQHVLIEQAKKVVAGELDEAKRKYKEAYEAGDSDALVSAQEALAKATFKAERVNNLRPSVQRETPVVQPAPQPVQETVRVDPKAAAWKDSNTWFGENDEMTAVALAVHRKLVEGGVSTNSDEYYEKIDSRMREVFPEAFPSARRKTSNVVAPASRSTAPKKIVLTQSQVNIAKRLGGPLEQYARQVAEEMRKANG